MNTPFIHPSSYVDDGAAIGSGTRVWHFCHIMTGAHIGRDCVLGQNVHVGPEVHVGDRCKLQNNVSLVSGVKLGDDVFCGPSVVFTNVLTPRSHISRKDAFAATTVGRGASLGANATILCGIRIGDYAMIGAGSVVTRDVAAHRVVIGNPAREVGLCCQCGRRLVCGPTHYSCQACEIQYVLADTGELERR